MFGFGVVPPPPRGPRRPEPKRGNKLGEKRRRQEMSASLAGIKDMGTVLLAVAVLAVIVVALSSL